MATNVIASRPPERRPTGMPHARAKTIKSVILKNKVYRHLHFLDYIGCPHICERVYAKILPQVYRWHKI